MPGLSLLLLVHASKVVIPGRKCLCRMLDRAHSRPYLDHWIRSHKEFRSDLQWWHTFIDHWNGVSVLAAHVNQSPATTVFTDTSGSWGCGTTDGVWWLQCQWNWSWHKVNITTKELVPILLGVGTWDQQWRNQLDLFFACVPKVLPHPSIVFYELWNLVVEEQPDWLSDSWRRKLRDF